jgi:hypothetical protein
MRKGSKILYIALGMLLLILMDLQFIVPAVYLTVGFILYLFFLLWAKAKNLDDKFTGWYYVLNSARGMLYFLLSGSFIWAPVLLPFVLERFEMVKRNRIVVWMQYIKNPLKIHQDWFKRFYQ